MIEPQRIAEERQKINDTIRAFFRLRDYIEVETPTLVASPDLAPNFTYFETTLIAPGEKSHQGALITSPEFSMKKLLGEGLEKIFTFARVFRNFEALGGFHNPEFTMLEWYTQGKDYVAMMDETETLVREVCAAFGRNFPTFKRVRVRDLLLETAGVDLDGADKAALQTACVRLKISTDSSDTESDLFYRLFLAKAEPTIGKEPTFLYEYPLCQAALAAKTPDGKYAQRVELYMEGIELSNGFTELTDPVEQRARFASGLAERRTNGKPTFPIDEELLRLLPSVRQPTFGNALGVDRLHMIVTGRSRIEAVLLFPASELF